MSPGSIDDLLARMESAGDALALAVERKELLERQEKNILAKLAIDFRTDAGSASAARDMAMADSAYAEFAEGVAIACGDAVKARSRWDTIQAEYELMRTLESTRRKIG